MTRSLEWEAAMLSDIKFAHGPVHISRQIEQCQLQHQSLVAITDSHSNHHTACYGWMLCLPNGEVLAEGIGPNLGLPSGPRAAAWGLLSVTTFLCKFIEYLHKPPEYMPTVNILGRNSKHIKYLRNRSLYPTLFCNTTLANNWDILEQSHQAITQSQIKVQWDTVQATRIAFQHLTPPPFSIDQSLTDVRETIRLFSLHQQTSQTKSPLLPASRCMLHSTTTTFHSSYNQIYREEATTPILQKYLQEKHGWNQQTSGQIKWEWFRQAVHHYKAGTPNHLTKLVYNQLATPDKKAKAGGQHWQDPICPHCHLQPQSFDHLLRCADTEAIEFRKRLISSTKSLCVKQLTPISFQNFLLHTIDAWLQQQPPKTTPDSTIQMHNLITSQNNIGWTNFTRGFVSQEWETLLHSENANGHVMKGTPFSFFSKLIVTMWQEQTAFWMAYQARRHSPVDTHSDLDSEKLIEIKQEISHLFTLREKVLPAHINSYFPQDLETFLKHSTTAQLQTYVANYGKAIKSSIRQHADQSIANTRTIFTYPGFQRDPTPTHNVQIPLDAGAIIEGQAMEQPPANNDHPNGEINPTQHPPNLPPPAPNEDVANQDQEPPAHPLTPPTTRKRIQQSILATFTRRRRPIQEITATRLHTPTEHPMIHINPQPNKHRQTVGDYISQLTRQQPTSNTSTAETEETTTPPVIATRASPHYKHSKWRPATSVREKFSQYFRKR